MSYFFTILSPTDTPLFSLPFGTSKGGGDGIARFRFPESAPHMNQFIIHSSLDIVEEAQWTNGSLYDSHLSILSIHPFNLNRNTLLISINQIPKTHRHIPPRRSLHLRLLNPLRRPLPPPPPTPATSINQQHRLRARRRRLRLRLRLRLGLRFLAAQQLGIRGGRRGELVADVVEFGSGESDGAADGGGGEAVYE